MASLHVADTKYEGGGALSFRAVNGENLPSQSAAYTTSVSRVRRCRYSIEAPLINAELYTYEQSNVDRRDEKLPLGAVNVVSSSL